MEGFVNCRMLLILDRGGLTYKLNRKQYIFSTGAEIQHSKLDGRIILLGVNWGYNQSKYSVNKIFDLLFLLFNF